MEYACPNARFLFFNGTKRYTVEYVFSISKWYVFYECKETDALYHREDKKTKFKNINKDEAENILYEYLDSKII